MKNNTKKQLDSVILNLDQLIQQLREHSLTKINTEGIDFEVIKECAPDSSFLVTTVVQLSLNIKQLIEMRPLLLCSQEYVNLCELIIITNEMADYLNNRHSPKWIQRHASNGKFLIKQFENLLIQGKNFYSTPILPTVSTQL